MILFFTVLTIIFSEFMHPTNASKSNDEPNIITTHAKVNDESYRKLRFSRWWKKYNKKCQETTPIALCVHGLLKVVFIVNILM